MFQPSFSSLKEVRPKLRINSDQRNRSKFPKIASKEKGEAKLENATADIPKKLVNSAKTFQGKRIEEIRERDHHLH